jgi:hypothetical protein
MTTLAVNKPGDSYEQEADRIANQVMAAPTYANVSRAPLQIQRFADSSQGQGDAAPASVSNVLASPGMPLEPTLRHDMEQRFGHDFSAVRTHTDAAAQQSARDVKAQAYTMGHDIVFGAGRFAPATTKGRRLIAHELTHVAQMSAFGSPSTLSAMLRLPILRKPESDVDADEEERLRLALAPIARLGNIPPPAGLMGGAARILIDWAEKKQSEFEDPQKTDEERHDIAQGLLKALADLRELEVKSERAPDGALVYFDSKAVNLKPWTQDRAHKLEDIAPFTAENTAEWREAAAWQPPVTVQGKQSPVTVQGKQRPKAKTSQQKQPAAPPEQQSSGVNVTFSKQEGMTFTNEEGQRRIIFALIARTRSGYTIDQLAWAVTRLKLKNRWTPPGTMDLPTWQKTFEAIPVGDNVTIGIDKKFDLELDNILMDVPSRRAFQLAGYRQGVLDAYGGMVLGYFLAGSAAAGAGVGALVGVGAGALGGWGLTTGSGLLAGGEGSLLLGGTLRQAALYAGRYLYLNAPTLFADTMLYTGAIASGVALGEHLQEIRSRGARWSDLRRLPEDLLPFAAGYGDWRYFRSGRPQLVSEEPPGSGAPPLAAPPASVRPADVATDAPRLTFPRRPIIQGEFSAPLAGSAAPVPAQSVTPRVAMPAAVGSTPPVAPVPPVMPKGLRGWRFGTKLKLMIEGAETSGVATKTGVSSTAITAKAPPSSPAPTPDLPPGTSTPLRAVSPAKLVIPSAQSLPVTTGEVPAPATPKLPVGIVRTGGMPAAATPTSGVTIGMPGTTPAVVVRSTQSTHDQVLELFVTVFQRPGPPPGTIVFHPTQESYDVAEQAAGFAPGSTLGFFAPADGQTADTNTAAALGTIHLRPTVSDLTALHEALHMISNQSGVRALLGSYVEEGLTEWLARSSGPVAERRAYDDNVAFVKLLATIVGADTLRMAYLHGLWGPLRSALRARLGGEADVEYFYRLLRRVGPRGENGRLLREAMNMLWPGSAEASTLSTPTPSTTANAVGASMPAATPRLPTTPTTNTPASVQAQPPSPTPPPGGIFENEPTDVARLVPSASQGDQPVSRHVIRRSQFTSPESLNAFLTLVWLRRQEILATGNAGAVYDLYRYKPDSASRTELSNEQRAGFIRSQETLAQEQGFPRLTQNEQGELAGRPGRRDGRLQFSIQQGDPETGFLHFYNRRIEPGPNQLDIVERIYLSVKAENALDVMRFVTRELVNNAQTTGIGGAKLAGPGEVGRRRDAIVIYSEGSTYTQRAVERLREYQRTHPNHFEDFPVPMTQPVSRGISIGSDPVGSSEEVSFGSVRAQAIYDALREATTREDFFHRVEQNFRSRRVDPAQPRGNLPPPIPPPSRPTQPLRRR